MAIVAVWGAPQSGKTTLATNLAMVASRKGQSVCLISACEYSELSTIFDVEITKIKSLGEALRSTNHIKQNVFKIDDLLFVLSRAVDDDVFDDNFAEKDIKNLLNLARITYDLVIVDCSTAGDDAITAWALNMASAVLVCVGGNYTNMLWYAAVSIGLDALKNKINYVGCEISDKLDYNAVYDCLQVAPVGILPFVPDAMALSAENKMLCNVKNKAGKKYLKILEDLQWQLVDDYPEVEDTEKKDIDTTVNDATVNEETNGKQKKKKIFKKMKNLRSEQVADGEMDEGGENK